MFLIGCGGPDSFHVGQPRFIHADAKVVPGDLLLAPVHCDEEVIAPAGWVEVDCTLYVHKFAKGDPREWTFYVRRVVTP